MKNAYDNEKCTAENIARYKSKDDSMGIHNDSAFLDEKGLAEKKSREQAFREQVESELREKIEEELRGEIEEELREQIEEELREKFEKEYAEKEQEFRELLMKEFVGFDEDEEEEEESEELEEYLLHDVARYIEKAISSLTDGDDEACDCDEEYGINFDFDG